MKKAQKRGYKADFVLYDGTNFDEVKEMLDAAGVEATHHNEHEIILRSDTGIDTLRVGDFVVRGENGQVKTYEPSSFHVKYAII